MNRRDLIRLSILSLIAAVLPAPPETDAELRARIVREMLATPEGRRKLAESMFRSYQEGQARGRENSQVRKEARDAYTKTQDSWDRSARYLDRLGLWEYRENLGRWVRVPAYQIIEEGSGRFS